MIVPTLRTPGRGALARGLAAAAGVTLLTAILATTLFRPAFAAPYFEPYQGYTTGSTRSVAIADFNADGSSDLALVGLNGFSVIVMFGSGNGTFPTSTSFSVGHGTVCVATADLNGDGRPDLVTANSDSTVSVLLGTGGGNFGPYHSYRAGKQPSALAIGDFNADGRPDLAVANEGAASVSVLLQTTAGAYAAPVGYAADNSPRGVATADFNGDGTLDLAVANGASNSVSILIGAGNGTFGPKSDLIVGQNPRGLAAADLNSDGRQDLVVANTGVNSVLVCLNGGGGTFAKAWYPAGWDPYAVAIADLDADGRLDLVAANQGNALVSVFPGVGSGQFGSKEDFTVGSYPASVAIGQLNADARPDLVVSSSGTTKVSVLFQGAPRALLTATAYGGGSVIPSGQLWVDFGSSSNFTFWPNYGYRVSAVYVDGATVIAYSSYKFTNVQKSHTLDVVFSERPSVTITASAETGGSISPSGEVKAYVGDSPGFVFYADYGWQLSGVFVDSVRVGAPASYAFAYVQTDHTIVARFSALPTMTLTASAGTGGTISPQGMATVVVGESRTYSIVPDFAFVIHDVVVDGVSVGAVKHYTFETVSSNHTIAASFDHAVMFTIEASADPGGTLSPSGSVLVPAGSTPEFRIVPDPDRVISDVRVDGVFVGATGLYRFSPIAANHTIEVSFAAPLPITGARGLGLLGAVLAATALLALRFRPRSPVTPPSAD